MKHGLTVKDPVSGRRMEVWTTEPAVQCYVGNFLPKPEDGADKQKIGKSGKPYHHRTGLCLEAQVFPDSPNQHGKEGYTSARLNPGETYTHTTIYRFSAE